MTANFDERRPVLFHQPRTQSARGAQRPGMKALSRRALAGEPSSRCQTSRDPGPLVDLCASYLLVSSRSRLLQYFQSAPKAVSRKILPEHPGHEADPSLIVLRRDVRATVLVEQEHYQDQTRRWPANRVLVADNFDPWRRLRTKTDRKRTRGVLKMVWQEKWAMR